MSNFSNANALARQGQHQKAIALFAELIGNFPNFYAYHENCGMAYLALGDDQRAFECLAKAHFLSRGSSRAYETLRRAHDDTGVKLSVIVPVYNTGKYLERCLSSILNQTERSLEVIVINDGSTDNSLAIIQELMANDPRIVLIDSSEASGNPGTPRNRGIAQARGKYLGFVDSDDWIEADYYRNLLAAADSGDLDMVFAAGYRNFLDGNFRDVRYDARHFNNQGHQLHRYHESFMIWDKIYRTSLVQALGIRLGETKAAVDVPFILQAYYHLQKVGFTRDELGYNYRRESDTSVTVNFRKSSNCDFEIRAYQGVEQWCRTGGVAAQYRDLISFRKVSSYIYTLSVIAPEELPGFFQKIKPELKAIRRELVAQMVQTLKRGHLLEKFDAIVSGDAAAYVKAFRQGPGKPASQPASTSPVDKASFRIDGKAKGILFFPDWSKTNPYQKLFYASLAQNYGLNVRGYKPEHFTRQVLRENREHCDYLHLHWLHALMDITRDDGADHLLAMLDHARQLGYRIIYTAHNIISHDSEHVERERGFRQRAAGFYDHVLAHGDFAKRRLVDELGIDPAKVHVMPHGTYLGYYKNHLSREAARAKLGLAPGKFVFLFFGNIKGYKGIDALMEAFGKLRAQRGDAALVIAGRVFEEDALARLQGHADADANIVFRPGFIDDDEAQHYFNAADLVILPYRRILTSGAAMLSFAFNRPVIAPRSGLMPEFVEDGKHGWLFDDYAGMLALMTRCVADRAEHPTTWADQFDFTDLNARLRWPVLTAHPHFGALFGSAAPVDGPVHHAPYRYALIRILGNDLPGRHARDQSLESLAFTLANEPEFDGCLKLWVLNRIADASKKQRLIDLLRSHGKQHVDIPYEAAQLAATPLCFEDLPRDDHQLTAAFDAMPDRDKLLVDYAIFRHKNNYLINNNGARNLAIEEGRRLADWVFPWDGNCFLTEQSWAAVTASLVQRSDLPYHIVPMERLLGNMAALNTDHVPDPRDEPQIVFRSDAPLRFDEDLAYGLRPKVDALKRLGVPGVWDKSNRHYPWNYRNVRHGPHTFNYAWAGWVFRLFSGEAEQELNADERAVGRETAVVAFIQQHDRSQRYQAFDREALTFYDAQALDRLRAGGVPEQPLERTLEELSRRAAECLAHPTYSVIDKTTLAPSGDRRDYWHPAPYAWPNPQTRDGLPYIYKDGERVPGTRLYEPESARYDRTAIQRVFDETTTLALAGHVFSNDSYTNKACELVRRWFIDDHSAMNPHLAYAQVFMGKNGNKGTSSGLIETKDMYFFLDAVRLIRKSTFWHRSDEQAMQSWCSRFLDWLNTSEQGRQEARATNNHGVAFDLQTYALAAFLGDVDQMYKISLRALSRLKSHIDSDGRQPAEMKRTTTAHYTAFNLHLWFNLHSLLLNTSGLNLFDETRLYRGQRSAPLKLAASWVLRHCAGPWPFKQIDEFDPDRYQHLYHIASRYSSSIADKYKTMISPLGSSKVVFYPHDGIAPYWTLQR